MVSMTALNQLIRWPWNENKKARSDSILYGEFTFTRADSELAVRTWCSLQFADAVVGFRAPDTRVKPVRNLHLAMFSISKLKTQAMPSDSHVRWWLCVCRPEGSPLSVTRQSVRAACYTSCLVTRAEATKDWMSARQTTGRHIWR